MHYETEFSQNSNKIASWLKHKKDLKFLFPKEIETLHKSDIELRTQNPVTLKIVTPITVRKDSAFAKICYQKKLNFRYEINVILIQYYTFIK